MTALTKPRYGHHPATYSGSVLDAAAEVVRDRFGAHGPPSEIRAIDPFAGTGRKLAEHQLFSMAHWFGVELEPEWIEAIWVHEGDATELPYPDGYFQLAFTSPTYGNRLADRHAAKDSSKRYGYAFSKREALGVSLSDASVQLRPNNTGAHKWGEEYRSLHQRAWAELARVLAPGALLLLNVKNHVRTVKAKELTEEPYVRNLLVVPDGKKVKAKQEVDVVTWHANTLHDLGIVWESNIAVQAPGMLNGANREHRAEFERLLVGRKAA